MVTTTSNAVSKSYKRERDLPQLIPLWPTEIADRSESGSLLILQHLRRALRNEQKRSRAGHWSYDLNRHLSLVQAELADIAAEEALVPAKANDVKLPRHRRARPAIHSHST